MREQEKLAHRPAGCHSLSFLRHPRGPQHLRSHLLSFLLPPVLSRQQGPLPPSHDQFTHVVSKSEPGTPQFKPSMAPMDFRTEPQLLQGGSRSAAGCPASDALTPTPCRPLCRQLVGFSGSCRRARIAPDSFWGLLGEGQVWALTGPWWTEGLARQGWSWAHSGR